MRPTPLQPHPKGRTFSLVTEARVGEELVWESESTMLRRGKGDANGAESPAKSYGERTPDGGRRTPSPAAGEWRLGGDLGRRYAAVSGDRNPIHMHALTAKPLGFPAAIAHGMWTKARCLAALESRLPDAFAVDVSLPARRSCCPAGSRSRAPAGGRIEFFVRDAKKQHPAPGREHSMSERHQDRQERSPTAAWASA